MDQFSCRSACTAISVDRRGDRSYCSSRRKGESAPRLLRARIRQYAGFFNASGWRRRLISKSSLPVRIRLGARTPMERSVARRPRLESTAPTETPTRRTESRCSAAPKTEDERLFVVTSPPIEGRARQGGCRRLTPTPPSTEVAPTGAIISDHFTTSMTAIMGEDAYVCHSDAPSLRSAASSHRASPGFPVIQRPVALDDRTGTVVLRIMRRPPLFWMRAWDDDDTLTEDPQREISLTGTARSVS